MDNQFSRPDDVTFRLMIEHWQIYEINRAGWPVTSGRVCALSTHYVKCRFYENLFYATASGHHHFNFSLN